MPIDVARQDRCFAFRLDGVTAALEKRGMGPLNIEFRSEINVTLSICSFRCYANDFWN